MYILRAYNFNVCISVWNQCQFGCLFKQHCEMHKHLLLLLASTASAQDDKSVLQIATREFQSNLPSGNLT